MAQTTKNQQLSEKLKERQGVIESYEQRFLQVRGIIEKQDAELRDTCGTLDKVREQLAHEEAQVRVLQSEMENLKLAQKTEIAELLERQDDLNEASAHRQDTQIQEFSRKLKEKDKFIEALQMSHGQAISDLAQSKDSEISQLQD